MDEVVVVVLLLREARGDSPPRRNEAARRGVGRGELVDAKDDRVERRAEGAEREHAELDLRDARPPFALLPALGAAAPQRRALHLVHDALQKAAFRDGHRLRIAIVVEEDLDHHVSIL